MNSATRVLSAIPAGPGSTEQQFDQLLFAVAAVAMGSTDDNKRPVTSVMTYFDTLLPGSMAIQRLRTRYAAELAAEAQR